MPAAVTASWGHRLSQTVKALPPSSHHIYFPLNMHPLPIRILVSLVLLIQHHLLSSYGVWKSYFRLRAKALLMLLYVSFMSSNYLVHCVLFCIRIPPFCAVFFCFTVKYCLCLSKNFRSGFLYHWLHYTG